MLARNGYKTPLPADIVDAIEGVKSLHQQRRELYARIMRLKDAKRRNRGRLPNHATTCDDSYQDRLELLWEMRNVDIVKLVAKTLGYRILNIVYV